MSNIEYGLLNLELDQKPETLLAAGKPSITNP
jgi:hypothetical protein